MDNYAPRLLDSVIQKYFRQLPALAIEGAKGVGKTETCTRLVTQTLRLDIDDGVAVLRGGIDALRAQEKPLLVDEWQRYPQSWDYVRRLVDEDQSPGQYLITGSAEPAGAVTHSGAARIVRMRMRPLSLHERALCSPTVSIGRVLDYAAGAGTDVARDFSVDGVTDFALSDYVTEIIASGFPGLRRYSGEILEVLLDGYIDNIIQKEFPENGVFVRRPDVLRQWMQAYAAATAGTASYQKIMDAATAGEAAKPAKTTTQAYRDALDNLWITDRVDAWLPSTNVFAHLGKAPKHFLVDPALACRLLNITRSQLLRGESRDMLGSQQSAVLGRLFEALLAQSLQTYAAINRAQLRHFRSRKGDREIDFIIQRDFAVLAIEVKLSADITDADVVHLNWLAGRLSGYQVQKLVLNTGSHAYTRADGVHVVPAVLLGA
ncbi:MAG: DUF4143 domain-containing protein [Actinomycetes bacterium]|jgi:predicted AAA+ superfamily ATPase|nr:DUF4143 domain-containing protein [Actinomycetes bacterium]